MTALRVGFNAYLLTSPALRGWTRYAVNLLAALPAHGVRPVLYSTAPVHPDLLARLQPGEFDVRTAPPMRYLLWENRWLPRQLRADAIDVFHCPMNYGMPFRTHCPRVLTLHDAIDQVYYLRRAGLRGWASPSALRVRLVNWVARRRAHHVITVSEHAKGDIVNSLKVPAANVTVIHEAADPLFTAHVPADRLAAVRRAHALSRPYFLYVGGWEGRKNVPFLLRAFAAAGLPDVDLVLAGGKPQEREAFQQLAASLGVADRVKLLGFVPEAELPALYASAVAFVYPSEYEGFGLQVCEAMATGCPVLVARATSLPEIAGDGGETFALADTTELTALLRRVATDPAFRDQLAARARRRSAAFSWDRAAGETAAVYRALAGGGR
jgi:glycosyltransferase involved in cell wall biosynthesis